MRNQRLGAVAALAVGLVGCSPMHVPSDVAGDIPVVIVNESGSEICEFRLARHAVNSSPNFLKGWNIPNGSSSPIKVRAASYGASVANCAETVGGMGVFPINGPTEIHVTTNNVKSTSARAGYTAVTMLVKALPPRPRLPAPSGGAAQAEGGGNEAAGSTSCKPDGTEISSASDAHDCCGEHSTGVKRDLKNVTLCCSDMQSCNTLK